ncbi:uncharacterized protein LOC107001216 [Solanum pennellii]|uniref:Uncharacterized protein LOC107001216 n=1 Tax=Solanum pennellii TaxID=28526 RepID=A0ABM1FCD7_SOLPN|nr:uncharacterized protein LOC107001216 [Solanum pennellii]
MDPLKYIFQRAMLTTKFAKWQMLLSEFDIVYVTHKAIKEHALADHLAENPVGEEYESLKTYFHDEEVSFMGEDISETYPDWRLFFDGAENHQGKGIGAVLVSEIGQHYPMVAKLQFNCTNNMAEYEACILGLKMAIDMNVQGEWVVKNPKITPYVAIYMQKLCRFRNIEFRHTPRTQNELSDALATITSMIKHLDNDNIDPLDIELKEHPVHYSHVEVELDGLPWYFDIKKYLESGIYPESAKFKQKKSIYRMALNFFLSGEILNNLTLDLDLLKCIDGVEAAKLIEQIHAGVCGMHMIRLTLARKILRAGYFWMTMEHDCCKFVQKCHKGQVHGDLIRVPPHELNAMSSPWLFVAWGMDAIGPIEPAASNGHRFILVSIDYFTKWVEMNGAVEAANKNINKILRKMIDNHRVYGKEAVIPAEVKIPSLRIIKEAELSNTEWVGKGIDQLTLIDEKRMVVVCHGQLYPQRMIRAFTRESEPEFLKSVYRFTLKSTKKFP